MPPDINFNLGHSPTTPLPNLLTFLKHTSRHLVPTTTTIKNGATTTTTTTKHSPVYVVGNQSADLDSMVSAIVYSYFFSRTNRDNKGGHYVPLMNLPDVPSGAELRRLRPEFACALELSISSSRARMNTQRHEGAEEKEEGKDAGSDGEEGDIVQLLKEHIVTTADLRYEILSALKNTSVLASAATEIGRDKASRKLDLDCVLVDWNSLPHKVPGLLSEKGNEGYQGKGSIDGLSDLVAFSTTACIDHHADEGFVPPLECLPSGSPRVIEIGPGSCTSLIIREVRKRGLWPLPSFSSSLSFAAATAVHTQDKEDESHVGETQIAKLALAAILIDTNNLTAKGKVTQADRDAVSFLTKKITSSFSSSSSLKEVGVTQEWSLDSFFEEINHAKVHSLDLLTVDEVLGRDYKDWTEITPKGEKRVVGIASVVRPLEWIIGKAHDEELSDNSSVVQVADKTLLHPLLRKLKSFASQRRLDVVSIMTAFTEGNKAENDKKGGFARELLVWGLNKDCKENVSGFIHHSREELDLKSWNRFPVEGSYEYTGDLFIWQQGNLAKSRKQVAPLLRESIVR